MLTDLQTVVLNFFHDSRTWTLLGLIVLNLATGIIAALRSKTYSWQHVADFYRSRVVPGLIGYLVVYVLGALGADQLPGLHDALELLTQWGGAGVLAVALVASIAVNLQEAGAFNNPPPPPAHS